MDYADFAQRARQLEQELQRSDWLPPYNEEGVRVVHEELKQQGAAVNSLEAVGRVMVPERVVFETAIRRNRRCLLSYHQNRLDRIRRLRWEMGPVVPESLLPNLSPSELNFFNDYDKILTDYCGNFGERGIDLTADLFPQKEVHIQVRVLQDCGDIFTDQGAVQLRKGATLFLRRTDAVHMIRQGLLEHVQE
jgi:GINS complex subunit 1